MANSKMQVKIIEQEAKYKTEKKEQHIAIKDKEIVNKNSKIAFLASLCIAIFTSVVLYIIKQK